MAICTFDLFLLERLFLSRNRFTVYNNRHSDNTLSTYMVMHLRFRCFAAPEPGRLTWVLQQNNEPKNSKSTSECPDLHLIEMLLRDFKQAVPAGKPSNVSELQQFSEAERVQICLRLWQLL
ncbi:hypothetical protein CHARACLAT_009640 [Characodon lateralis]|uniref:Uncharacterized protein n=1 Tax=Characodon lateralis TaxID=208331 RepID=A0ABU7CP82_9TELE|nr:hypothetical protein [Characodon lateralis]